MPISIVHLLGLKYILLPFLWFFLDYVCRISVIRFYHEYNVMTKYRSICIMLHNIDKVCDDDSKYLSSRGYDILECNFINSTNNKLFRYKKIVGNYKNVQESIDLIQSRLEDFKIVNLVSRIIRYDIYYSYKNKNYFLNIISTCNEYKPKRSCDDENDKLKNLVNNLIFTAK